jgi:hypothetical protein
MKKIIFVGGTARSGSTLLDLILANDPKAMSLGEINALFYPTRKHHFEVISKIKESDPWKFILEGGKKALYSNLIKKFPNVNIFVDSSKDPFWFNYHQKRQRSNYLIQNVLIHKSPAELANSFIKRGKDTEWIRTYLSYHRKYFSLIDKFVAISYKDLIKSETHLKKLCEVLEINYFQKKINYWDRNQNSFFGSNSVKSYYAHKAKSQLTNQKRKDIKYDGIQKDYIDHVKKSIENNPALIFIENEIIRNDIFCKVEKNETKEFGYTRLYLFLFSIKRYFKHKYYFYFPQNIFK